MTDLRYELGRRDECNTHLSTVPEDTATVLFNCEHPDGLPPRYARDMQLERIKWILTGVWVMTAAIVGLVIRDVTWQIWAAFIALAVLPPVALLLWWTQPAQTMSETINEARGKTWPS